MDATALCYSLQSSSDSYNAYNNTLLVLLTATTSAHASILERALGHLLEHFGLVAKLDQTKSQRVAD
jgi:hypothetical protein